MRIRDLAALVLSAALAACGGNDSPAPPAASTPQGVPATEIIRGETSFIVEGKTRYRFWQSPNEIVSVVQAATGRVYLKDRDYTLDRGQLVILPGSAIPKAPAAFIQTVDAASSFVADSVTKEGGPLRIANDYPDWQIAVTYTSPIATRYNMPVAKPLPAYAASIAAGKMPSITIYGDSIAGGAGAGPGMGWSDLLAAKLAGRASVRNVAVAGWGAGQGLAAVDEKVNDRAQDVVVLAFGMDDASWTDDAALFMRQMQGMIEAIRGKAPATEFVLVSGMRGNPDWQPMRPVMFDQYREVMNELAAAQPGVTVVDMTSVWDSLMAQKSFDDLTCNGVNHPNDFGHALYAQLMIALLAPSTPISP